MTMSQAASSTPATRRDDVSLGPLSREQERVGVRGTLKLPQSIPSLSPRERVGVRARQLRANATDAETLLWQRLRSRQLAGYKFRRQHPVGMFFADFACMEARLVVELDGGQHATPEGLLSDERRSAALATQGYLVLRFWNHDVLQQTDVVLESILCGLRERCPHPGPLPKGEGKSRSTR